MPRIVDKEAMQARILEAAYHRFAEQGFHATRMDEIAREAGLAKGTLYLYFPSKEALAVGLIRARFARYGAALDALPPETLEAFFARLRAGLELSNSNPGETRLFFDLMGPGFPDDAVRREIGAFFARMGALWARQLGALQQVGQLRAGADCAALGPTLASLLDGLVMHRALFNLDEAEFRRRIDTAIDTISTGLAA